MMKFKTWTPQQSDLDAPRDWYVVDATGMTLGRLASSVARILTGKHKPTYSPHQSMGDHVVVINAAQVAVTGRKLDQKEYVRYSGYPGGLRKRTLRHQRDLDAAVPIRSAIAGMLQKNRQGAATLRRLRVYAGADHGHQAQQPRLIAFNNKGDIDRA
jgi:large subunit ribosomal protein L13